MHDPMTFEARLAEAFDRYGVAAPTAVDSRALAATLLGARPSRLAWPVIPWPRATGLRLALVLGLLALASAAALLVAGGLLRPDPAPLGGGRILVWLQSGPGGGMAHLLGVDGIETASRSFESRSGGCPVLLAGADGVATRGYGNIRFVPFSAGAASQVSVGYTGGERWSPDHRVLALMNSDDDSVSIVTFPDGDTTYESTIRYPLGFSLDSADGAFSADGRRFVVTSVADAATSRVSLIEEGATQPRDLAMIPARGSWVSWAPDGSRFVIVTKDEGGSQLTMITVADGTTRQLGRPGTLRSGEGLVPLTWSNDGRYLLVRAEAGDAAILDIMGGGFRSVGTQLPSDPAAVRWSPDGSSLAIITGTTLTVHPLDGAPDRTVHLPGQAVGWAPAGAGLAVLADGSGLAPTRVRGSATVWIYHPWDATPAQVLATIPWEASQAATHPGPQSCIQWLPEVTP